jgi:hypothetical protein
VNDLSKADGTISVFDGLEDVFAVIFLDDSL